MIAAAGFLISLFFLKSQFLLFLFCIIDHNDLEKERNFLFFLPPALQVLKLLLDDLVFSSFLIQRLNSDTYSRCILYSGGASPSPLFCDN